LKSCLC
jgi:hypothetical protein